MKKTLTILLGALSLMACPPAEHLGVGDKDAAAAVVGDAHVEGGAVDAAGVDRPVQDSAVADAGPRERGSAGDRSSAVEAGGDGGAPGSDATVLDAGSVVDATTPGDASGPVCSSDRDCALETLCVAGHCQAGCNGAGDCPRQRPVCDANAGLRGACVECVQGSDCGGGLDRCVDNVCTKSCAQPSDCRFPLSCDTNLGYCVRCIDDDQCPYGQVCEASACVDGCRDDSSCRPGEICDNNRCSSGCRATPADSCPVGFHCNTGSNLCEEGCGTSADQCPPDHTCIANQCYAPCGDNGSCPAAQHCDSGYCVEGCAGGTCGFGQVCDTTQLAVGECVQCYDGDASSCSGVPGTVCDTVNRECTLQCTDANSIWACETARGWSCDSARENLCVECLASDDCGAYAHCDTALGRCIPDGGRPLCAPCQDDGECGGEGDLCVRRSYGVLSNETVCGVDCSLGQSCPQGTACQDVGDPVVRGRQCMPVNSLADPDTCAARRDLVEHKQCQRNFACGMTRNDAICSGYGSSQGHCSLLCDPAVPSDCPAGFVCYDPPAGGDRDPPPRCSL